MKSKLLTVSAIIAVLAIVLILRPALTATPRIYKKSEILMDTVITLTVVSNSEKKAGEAIDTAFKYLRQYEKMLSFSMLQARFRLLIRMPVSNRLKSQVILTN